MKMYYFSVRKHGHDIEFRYDRCRNEIGRLQLEGKPVPKSLENLADNLNKIRDYTWGASVMCNGAVQLPANLYRIAIETVGWAASMR